MILAYANNIFSQDALPGSVKKLNKAKIRTRTEYLYFLDKNPPESFKCQKKYFNRNGNDTLSIVYSITSNKPFSKIIKKFDSLGNIIEKLDYKIENIPASDFKPANKAEKVKLKTAKEKFILEMRAVYKFNEKGRFLTKQEFDENNNLIGQSSSEYVYDKFDRIIEVKNTTDNPQYSSSEIYEYDSLGNKSRFQFYSAGKFKTRMDYSYDSLNRLTKIIIQRDSLRNMETEISKYDLKGNRVYKEILDKDGQVVISQIFKYDKNNRYIEMIRITGNKPSEYQRIKITYDKYGNITTNTKYQGEGKPYRRQVYKYTYYK